MKNMNKIIASLLVGSMVFSLAACGNDAGTGDNTSTTPAETGTPTSDAAPAEIVKPDTITVMWDGTVFKEGDNYAEEFYAALNEALGIEVKWTRPDHSTYGEQVGIAFNDASTLADVVILPSNYYASYAKQGNLWNMTDAWLNSDIATSGRLTSVAPQIIDGWYTEGPDGQKGIYAMYPARGNGCITYVKATWAKNAGYDSAAALPKNWAEYQDFLLAMKSANGGKAPVLAAGLVNDGEAPYTNYLPEFYQDAYPDIYQKADGTWVDGFTEQAMIDALERLNWGYSNGVLEASILEKPSTADVRNKFYDDTTGVFTYWAGTWAYTIKSNLAKNNLDDEVWNLPPIAELGSYMERLSPMIAITTSCKNPEGVFKYFIDPILDGGDVQMLWQYGVEGVHYEWNADGQTISGLATQSTAGTDKESKTTKNLFEANLKLGNFSGVDPYTPEDPVIDEAFSLFDQNSSPAPGLCTSETYLNYSASLWTEKSRLISEVTQGTKTAQEAIDEYKSLTDDIVNQILAECN